MSDNFNKEHFHAIQQVNVGRSLRWNPPLIKAEDICSRL